MRLIRNTKTDKFHEIEVEETFLWWKKRVFYRKVNNNIFIYKEPNTYINTNITEYIDVKDLFDIKL